MLRQRLLTALVILPLLLAALFFLDSFWIAVVFGLVATIGAWEWGTLAGLRFFWARVTYVMALIAIGLGLVYWVSRYPGNAVAVATVSAVFWLVAFIELVRRRVSGLGLFGSRGAKLISGAIVLLPTWVCAYFLHASDSRAPMLLLWMLSIVWVADSAAYLVGTTMGRHKLAPSVSPGKTVEGVIGGLVAVALVAALGGLIVPGFTGKNLLWWTVLGVLVAAISVVGDLLESKYKRLAGVKDSGRLLPGHGGMLDRIDAVTSAAPAFVLGWYALFAGAR